MYLTVLKTSIILSSSSFGYDILLLHWIQPRHSCHQTSNKMFAESRQESQTNWWPGWKTLNFKQRRLMSSHECFSPLCLPCLTFGTGATTYQSQQQHTKIPNFKKVLHGTLATCPERNVFKLNLIVQKVYWLINVLKHHSHRYISILFSWTVPLSYERLSICQYLYEDEERLPTRVLLLEPRRRGQQNELQVTSLFVYCSYIWSSGPHQQCHVWYRALENF